MGVTTHDDPCLSDETLVALIGGGLSDRALAAVHDHADRCAQCRDVLVGLARAQRQAREADAPTRVPGSVGDAESEIGEGTQIDHYRVTRLLGEGGMGRVFEARDQSLARRVALKVVRGGDGQAADPQRTVRLVREAQAMAQLSHPNVLTVYGVGTFEGEVYFAMEYIDGVTLRHWLTQRARPWPQTLRTFVAAGRGLAAAHAAGLVHRDFKPHNVLIAHDGRVLVTDFGLVAQRDDASTGPVADSWDRSLTATGALLGTPAYMAPEQFQGEPTGPRSDQFSFCVSLTEALFGHHPFAGDVRAAAEAPQWHPQLGPGRRVPARLRRVLAIGLQKDPAERHASMDVLLEHLEGVGRSRTRRRVGIGAVTALGVTAAAVAWFTAGGQPRHECGPAVPGEIAGAWDASRRLAVQQAMTARRPVGRESDGGWLRVQAHLDAYATSWGEMVTEACEATHVRKEVSAGILDATMVCLDRRRRAVRAVTDLLASPTGPASGPGLDAVRALPPLSPCANLQLLKNTDPMGDDPELRARIDAADRLVNDAYALAQSGSAKRAIDRLEPQLNHIDGLGYRPLQAQARQTLGIAYASVDVARAKQLRRRAYALAVGARADDLAANLALSMAQNVALTDGDVATAKWWLELAQTHAEEGGLAIEFGIAVVRGTIARTAGDLEQAARWYAQAVEVAQPSDLAGGSRAEVSDARRAAAYSNLAAIYLELKRFDDAREPLRRAAALTQDAFGESDARTLERLANEAGAKALAGDCPSAARSLRDVLGRQRRWLGPDEPAIAITANLLGTCLRKLGQLREGRSMHVEALRIRTAIYGGDSTQVAICLQKVAHSDVMLGEHETAAVGFERAAGIFGQVLGSDHVLTAQAYSDVARARRQGGQLDLAQTAADRALAAIDGPRRDPDRRLVQVPHERGWIALERGRFDVAEPLLRQALAMAEAAGTSARDRAQIRYNLARALAGLQRPEAALAAANRAAAELAGGGEDPDGLGPQLQALIAGLTP